VSDLDVSPRTTDNIPGMKLPKLHALQHYISSIENYGTTDNYNTESTERLHIDLAKHAFQATNKRDFIWQMCRWLERRERVHWFGTYLAWRSGMAYDARVHKAQLTQRPIRHRREALQMAKRPHKYAVRIETLPHTFSITGFIDVLRKFLRDWHQVPVWRGWETALPLQVERAICRLPSIRAWWHATFRMPDTQTLAAKDTVNKVYASPKHGRYDTVLVQTRGDDVAGTGGLDGAQARLVDCGCGA